MIYLDNAATTPLKPDVIDYITSVLNKFGNPSSIHQLGKETKELLNQARSNIAKFINANEDEIIFTSGGSASNTLAIRGFIDTHKLFNLYYSPICHKSIISLLNNEIVSKTAEQNFIRIRKLEINENSGTINLDSLFKQLVYDSPVNPFVVIEYANSEIGTVQPFLKEIIDLVHQYHGFVYLDCTGSMPYIPIDVKELDVDMLGFSGHKLGALKGVGVLYKKSIRLTPIVFGSQEKGLFAGTENILGILSLDKAIETIDYNLEREKIQYFRDEILKIPNTKLIGAKHNRLPYNVNICFKGVDSNQLLGLLDQDNIYVSTGSACNSGNKEGSYVLKEIGLLDDCIHSCIRFSFSGKESIEEINFVIDRVKENVEMLRLL